MHNYIIKSSIFKYALLLFILSSCQHSTTKNSMTLYQQLGGEPVIYSLTVNLVDRLFNHDKIGFLFNDSDSNREDLIKHISEQICQQTGGGCKYEGRDMQEAHSGLDIRLAEFDLFVQVFIAAMEDVNIPFTEQNKVLALFAVMRDDVVKQ